MTYRLFNEYGAMQAHGQIASDRLSLLIETFIDEFPLVDLRDLECVLHNTVGAEMSFHILKRATEMRKAKKGNEA